MRLNQTKFASLVKCSQQNISKLIKKGVIQKEDDNKIDVEKAKQSLKDFGLLDENGVLKKSRTPKKEKKSSRIFVQTTSSLPLEGEVPYASYEYLSEEEKDKIEKEKQKAYEEFKQKEEEAKNKNIKTGDDNLEEVKFADAKAHREHYMGKIAEYDYLIKIGEYVSKQEVEQTFFEASRRIRDALLNYPNKMALRVVGKTDIKDIEDVLMEEIQIILGNLSHES